MRRPFRSVVLVLALAASAGVASGQPAPEVVLGGTVRDAETGEPLPGATIYVAALERGAAADEAGRYRLALPAGRHLVVFDFVGYRPEERRLVLRRDTLLDVGLVPRPVRLGEVVARADRLDDPVQGLQVGTTRLEAAEIRKLPTFLGEVDVTRSLLLLPGVSTVGEGAAGFNVRGGNVEHNLVLLDGAPLFYPSHLFGFFSLFNPAVLDEVTLHRAGIPPGRGGRLASVLDVRLREGSHERFGARGGVGLVASNLSLEGPLHRGRTSFIAAGRGSYVDWLLRRVPDVNVRESSAWFYDAHAGLSHRFGPAHRLDVSAYRSRDAFRLASDTLYSYGTQTAVVRWSRPVRDRLLAAAAAVFTDYDFRVEGQRPGAAYTLDARIRYGRAQLETTWLATERHTVTVGAEAHYYGIRPGTLRAAPGSSLNATAMEAERMAGTALYAGDEWRIGTRLALRAGLRLSTAHRLGPGTVYLYEPGAPRDPATVVDTLSYGRGAVMRSFVGLEPRLSARLSLGARSSVKLSYDRMRQPVHLVSNTMAVTPVDVWTVAGRHLPPQVGDQVSAGYFRSLPRLGLTASAEAYYKTMRRLPDYQAGAELLLNPRLEADLVQGEGRAYGFELLLRRPEGTVNGWLAYTLARAERRVRGRAAEERINDGRFYPAPVDRPHDLALVLSYQETPRLSWNLNFVYSSGRPVTFPTTVYRVDGIPIAGYSTRNQHRIPPYHRLDLSVTASKDRGPNARWRDSWTFAVYNVYGRKNPYSVFFRPDAQGLLLRAYRLAVLGHVFPSLTYRFEY